MATTESREKKGGEKGGSVFERTEKLFFSPVRRVRMRSPSPFSSRRRRRRPPPSQREAGRGKRRVRSSRLDWSFFFFVLANEREKSGGPTETTAICLCIVLLLYADRKVTHPQASSSFFPIEGTTSSKLPLSFLFFFFQDFCLPPHDCSAVVVVVVTPNSTLSLPLRFPPPGPTTTTTASHPSLRHQQKPTPSPPFLLYPPSSLSRRRQASKHTSPLYNRPLLPSCPKATTQYPRCSKVPPPYSLFFLSSKLLTCPSPQLLENSLSLISKSPKNSFSMHFQALLTITNSYQLGSVHQSAVGFCLCSSFRLNRHFLPLPSLFAEDINRRSV